MARILDDWLKHYVAYNAYNEAPVHFHFWTGVGVIAAALRRKVHLPMHYFQWTPNFYIILVAPPGIVTKSTTLSIGQSFINALPGIHIGPNSVTWQALITEFTEINEAVPINGDFHPMSCMSFFISELGNFMDFEDKKMIDLLVELWDGKIGNFARRTQINGRVEMINPWINILGCTTPAWLSDNMPQSMIHGGLSARCIWLFGTKKKRRIAYPQKLIVPGEIEILRTKLAHDLAEIASLRGEFKLTEEAYAFGTRWYETHCDKIELGDPSASGMSSYIARAQTHVHKLAMVLSVAKRDDLIIGIQELEAAVAVMDSIETEMPQVFTALNTSVDQEKAGDIVAVVRQRRRIRRTELYHMFFHKMGSKEFNEAISSAVEAGLITQTQSGATVFLSVAGAQMDSGTVVQFPSPS